MTQSREYHSCSSCGRVFHRTKEIGEYINHLCGSDWTEDEVDQFLEQFDD